LYLTHQLISDFLCKTYYYCSSRELQEKRRQWREVERDCTRQPCCTEQRGKGNKDAKIQANAPAITSEGIY
jgi:hypothetical protein